MDDTFNVAVIGAGYWGKKVIGEYLQLARDDAKVGLSMVCDIKNENLAYCQKEYGIPEGRLSLSCEEAFNSGSVDAVHICTPNETHHEICKQALLAGKHVLLEKPMAMCARHAWELVGLAEHKGLILQVGHIFRFNNALRTVRDLVAQNYFGTLYYLKLQWTTLMSSPMHISSSGTYRPKLDPSRCNSCSLCLEVCPSQVDFRALERRIFNSNSNDPFLGKYLNLYIGRATDRFFLDNSTSGGLVTALLCHCLGKNAIRGALVTTMGKEGSLEPNVVLAQSEKEVVAASKSQYMPVPVNVGLEQIEAHDGKYAIVGLPCHIHGVRKAEKINRTLDARLYLHFGLFCSHTVNLNGTNMLIAKLDTHISKVVRLSYRTEGWPGFFSIRLRDGIKKKIAFGKVWAIFGSFFFVPTACLLCCDLTNELADISFGDAWLPELKGAQRGYSLVITRSDKGEELLQNAQREGKIRLKKIERSDILKSHKLGLLFKKRTYYPRCAMVDRPAKSRTHNVIIPQQSGFLYFLLAFLALLNAQVSSHRIFSSMIEKTPFGFFQIYDAIFTRYRILCSRTDKLIL